VRKVLLTMIGTLSIATAVIAPPAVTRFAKDSPSAAVAAGCSQARILEPGSRGNVVEI
jgi:hypothetical protein